MTTYTVRPGGLTLTSAFAKVRPGDEVDVLRGTYSGQVLKADRVTVNFAEGAVIDAKGAQHALLVMGDRVTINGGGFTGSVGGAGVAARGADFFSFVGGEAYGNQGNGVSLIGLDGAVVRGAYVHDNVGGRNDHSSGLSIYHLTENPNVASAYGVRVIECRFEDNGTKAATDGNNLIVDKLYSSTATIYDRPILIGECEFRGAGGSGAYVYLSNNVTFRNDLFEGNATDDGKLATEIGFNTSTGDRLFGSTFHADKGEFDFYSGGKGHNTLALGAGNHWDGPDQRVAPWSNPANDHPAAAAAAHAYAVDPHETFPQWYAHDDVLLF